MHAITLSTGDIARCERFADRIAERQQRQHHQVLEINSAYRLGLIGEFGFSKYMGLGWQPKQHADPGYDMVTKHGTKIDVKTSTIDNPYSKYRKNLLWHHNRNGERADVYVLAWYHPHKRMIEFPGFAMKADYDSKATKMHFMKRPTMGIYWQQLRSISTLQGKPILLVDWRELPQ